MATELPGFKLTGHFAGEDLSGAQYRFVKLDAQRDVVRCTAITDEPIGILQNDPVEGEEAEIMVTGRSKVVADGVIAVGAEVGTSADGEADSIASGVDTTVFKVARALDPAAAAGEIISVLVDCLAPARAA